MGLLKGQTYAAPQRGLPTDDKGGSSQVIPITGETVQLYYWNSGVRTIDAGQVAGIVVEGKLESDNIKNAAGSMEGTSSDTSLSFTSTALTTEVQFDIPSAETYDSYTGSSRAVAITSNLKNGEYVVDYATGMVYGKKADTSVTLTDTAYKIAIELNGGGTVVTSDINLNKVGGTSTNTNGGNRDTGTQTVTLADDDPAVSSLAAIALNTEAGGTSTATGYVGKTSGLSDFTVAYASGTTLTIGNYPDGSTLNTNDIVSIAVFDNTGALVEKIVRDDLTLSISGSVLTVTGFTDDFVSTDEVIIETNVARDYTIDKGLDVQKIINQGTVDRLETDPITLVTAQDLTASLANFGSSINCSQVSTIGVFILTDVNNSETVTLEAFAQTTSGSAALYTIDGLSAKTLWTTGASDGYLYYEFEVGAIPFLQLQAKAGTVGATAGDLTISVRKVA